MHCKHGQIFYTLDSNEPTENSIQYTGSIKITDASKNENVYCNNRDVYLEYRLEIIEK